MARLTYGSAETLLYDPIAANRTATRATLYTLGFRYIESVATLEDFTESIKRRSPDLVLCEAQGADAALCELIQALRQGDAGYNPFIVVIVTAWENTKLLVKRVLNSGADDLILRPFSTAQLGQRIDTHVERRKGFVVTTDYVGPDRRRDGGRSSNVELFEPPNSLKMKAKEHLSIDDASARLEGELREARDMMLLEKLRRDTFQICILWRLLQDNSSDARGPGEGITKLARLTASVAKRCREQGKAVAADWCDSVLAAVEGLELGVDRNASMHLLGNAALNLHQVFHPGKSSGEALSEIEATVAVIRARGQKQLAS